MSGVVIIGSGLAGYTLAKEFRKLPPDTPLRIVTADDGAPYSKPLPSYALAKRKTAETLPTATAAQMAEQLKAVITTHAHVTSIDTAAHTISTDHETVSYGQLVLCTGAEQLHAPLEGEAAATVLSVNGLADYAVFREALEKAGVEWHLGVRAQRVVRRPRGFAITRSNGAVVEADCVLSAIGLRPKLALAQQAGLHVHRGIVVDRHLHTSADQVYALGDCAEVEGLVLPFVMPIMHAARALAQTLAGTPTAVTYPAMPVIVKTPACPIVVSPPPPDAAGQWEITPLEGGVRALYRAEDGRLLGMALTGHAAAERQQWSKELPAVLA